MKQVKKCYFSPRAKFMLVSTNDSMSDSNEKVTPPANVNENQGE